jgi:hypothetical protein
MVWQAISIDVRKGHRGSVEWTYVEGEEYVPTEVKLLLGGEGRVL